MSLHAFDPFRATQARLISVSKMLSAAVPMNGGNGRKPGGKRGGVGRVKPTPGTRFRVRTMSVAFPASNDIERRIATLNACIGYRERVAISMRCFVSACFR